MNTKHPPLEERGSRSKTGAGIARPPGTKVLHVCTAPITARTFIAPFARALETRGYNVTIACADDRGPENGPAIEEMQEAGLRLKVVDIPRTIRPIADARAAWTLYRFIRAEQFAIVHTQTAQAGFLGRWAARLARVPVVIHTAHAFPFHALQQSPMSRLYALMERLAGRWCDLIIVDSAAVRSEGLRHGIAPAEKLLTIPMGIDLHRFSFHEGDRREARDEWGLDSNEMVVGTVARLVPDKGLDCFLDVAARVSAQLPRVRFLVVGGGPLRPALERQAQVLGINERIVFTGVRSDVPRQLAAMDLFVLPTRREGFGVAFAEAMAMGRAVVGSDIEPIREVVTNGEHGILLPPEDRERFAEAILALLADAPLRQAMGAAGRRRVEAAYDERRVFAATEAEYQRLLRAKERALAS